MNQRYGDTCVFSDARHEPPAESSEKVVLTNIIYSVYIYIYLWTTHFLGVSRGCYLTEVGASLYP